MIGGAGRSLPACPKNYKVPVPLYGCNGENAGAKGKVPELGHVGYKSGVQKPGRIPRVDVRIFGAKADGKTDCSNAVKKALMILPAQGGLVYFPKGTYLINSQVELLQSQGLMGDGPGATTLLFPRCMRQIKPKTSPKQFEWTDGVITIYGEEDVKEFSPVTKVAPRGGDSVCVRSTKGLAKDTDIQIVQDDVNGEFFKDLLGGSTPPRYLRNKRRPIKFLARVVEILKRNCVKLDRRLNYAIKPSLRAKVLVETITPSATLSKLTVKFKEGRTFPGLGARAPDGCNAIYVFRATNIHISDVAAINADQGVILSRTRRVTIEKFTMKMSRWRSRRGRNEHCAAAVSLRASTNTAVVSLNVDTTCARDVWLREYASGTVITGARGQDLSLCFDKELAVNVMASQLDVGGGNRLFCNRTSAQNRGKAGAPVLSQYSTFWQVKASKRLAMPDPGLGPGLNFVSVRGSGAWRDGAKTWQRQGPENAKDLFPQNLYSVQNEAARKAFRLPAVERIRTEKGYWCDEKGKKCEPGKCKGRAMRANQGYGCDGEAWDSNGLPLPAFAGYRQAGAYTPKHKVVGSVRDFGAKAGERDSTKAFLKAVDALNKGRLKSGALYIPCGRYTITARLTLTRPGTSLRGCGKGKTVLHFPRSLRRMTGRGGWGYSGGVISLKGWDWVQTRSKDWVGFVAKDAPRGSTMVCLDRAVKRVRRGGGVRLVWTAGYKDLTSELMCGASQPTPNQIKSRGAQLRVQSRVRAVAGRCIELDRPLPTAARTKHRVLVVPFDAPWVGEMGVEDLTIEFPRDQYPGHFKEAGYNGVSIDMAFNSWVKRVEVKNPDLGVVMFSSQCVVEDVVISSDARRQNWGRHEAGATGHYGICIGFGSDNLVHRYQIKGKFHHDNSVYGMAHSNVFSEGSGYDLSLDHHATTPFGNLFTSLDAGIGSRIFSVGGRRVDGPGAGAWNVYHNIRTHMGVWQPPKTFGSCQTLAGLDLVQPGVLTGIKELAGYRVAPSGGGVVPENLYEAIMKKRKAKARLGRYRFR